MCAHTSRLRAIIRNWTARSLPPASKAVSWPVALQSAGRIDTEAAIKAFVVSVAPLLTVHMGCLSTPDQLAGQLALKVHRALWKCPFLNNIYTQALSQVIERPRQLALFFNAVCLSARGNAIEFRHCLERFFSHLYRQQALHILERPTSTNAQNDFDPDSPFSKALHAHLSCCFASLFGIRR